MGPHRRGQVWQEERGLTCWGHPAPAGHRLGSRCCLRLWRPTDSGRSGKQRTGAGSRGDEGLAVPLGTTTASAALWSPACPWGWRWSRGSRTRWWGPRAEPACLSVLWVPPPFLGNSVTVETLLVPLRRLVCLLVAVVHVFGLLPSPQAAGPPQPSPGGRGVSKKTEQECSPHWWGTTTGPFQRPLRAAEGLVSLLQHRPGEPTSSCPGPDLAWSARRLYIVQTVRPGRLVHRGHSLSDV